MIYVIGYDLKKPGQDYKPLYAAIEAIGGGRILDSRWLVSTTITAEEIRKKLLPLMDANDNLLVGRFGPDWDGYLSQTWIDWIQSNIR